MKNAIVLVALIIIVAGCGGGSGAGFLQGAREGEGTWESDGGDAPMFTMGQANDDVEEEETVIEEAGGTGNANASPKKKTADADNEKNTCTCFDKGPVEVTIGKAFSYQLEGGSSDECELAEIKSMPLPKGIEIDADAWAIGGTMEKFVSQIKIGLVQEGTDKVKVCTLNIGKAVADLQVTATPMAEKLSRRPYEHVDLANVYAYNIKATGGKGKHSWVLTGDGGNVCFGTAEPKPNSSATCGALPSSGDAFFAWRKKDVQDGKVLQAILEVSDESGKKASATLSFENSPVPPPPLALGPPTVSVTVHTGPHKKGESTCPLTVTFCADADKKECAEKSVTLENVKQSNERTAGASLAASAKPYQFFSASVDKDCTDPLLLQGIEVKLEYDGGSQKGYTYFNPCVLKWMDQNHPELRFSTMDTAVCAVMETGDGTHEGTESSMRIVVDAQEGAILEKRHPDSPSFKRNGEQEVYLDLEWEGYKDFGEDAENSARTTSYGDYFYNGDVLVRKAFRVDKVGHDNDGWKGSAEVTMYKPADLKNSVYVDVESTTLDGDSGEEILSFPSSGFLDANKTSATGIDWALGAHK